MEIRSLEIWFDSLAVYFINVAVSVTHMYTFHISYIDFTHVELDLLQLSECTKYRHTVS